jgi:hypothetical protein
MAKSKNINHKWTKKLGPPTKVNHYFPPEVHDLLKAKSMKELVTVMALKPEFAQSLYALAADEPE